MSNKTYEIVDSNILLKNVPDSYFFVLAGDNQERVYFKIVTNNYIGPFNEGKIDLILFSENSLVDIVRPVKVFSLGEEE